MADETNKTDELSELRKEDNPKRSTVDMTDNEEADEINTYLKYKTSEEQKKGLNFRRVVLQMKTDKSYRQKIIHTAILCWSFIGLGWSAGMNGPTFPDLRLIIQEDLAKSAWMFTVGSFGYLSGSLVGGILYDKLDKVLLLAVCSVSSVISTLLTPYCSTLALMLFIKFSGGFFFGGLDTGGNADIINVWGKDVDPYMQALHFAFSLGALLSPLATEPFLSEKRTVCFERNITSVIPLGSTTEETKNSVTHLVLNDTNSALLPGNSTNTLDCTDVFEETKVHYAFITAAMFMVVSAAGFIFLYSMLRPKRSDIMEVLPGSDSKNNVNIKRKQMTISFKIIFLVLLASLMAAYCVTEDSFASFLMTFSLDYLKWDKSHGSFATAIFWLSFGVGRFAGIFIVSCCRNSTLLTTYLFMQGFGYLGILVTTTLKYYPLIWVFIAVLGFSMSVIFPAIFSWTSEHITHVSGKISALFLISTCLAGMLFPLLIGNLMEHYHPMWFVYIMVIMSFTCILLYIFIRILDKCCLKHQILNNYSDEIEVAEGTEMTLM